MVTNAMELPVSITGGASAALEREHLPLWKATAFGLAALQVGPGLGYSAAYVYGVAGNAAWLCLTISMVGSLAVAVAVSAGSGAVQ